MAAASSHGTGELTGALGSAPVTEDNATGTSATEVSGALDNTAGSGAGSTDCSVAAGVVDGSDRSTESVVDFVVSAAGFVSVALSACGADDSEPLEFDDDVLDSVLTVAWLTTAPLREPAAECLREVEDEETLPPVDTGLPAGAGPVPGASASEASDTEPRPRPLPLECAKVGVGSASLASVLPPLELTVVDGAGALLRCGAGFDGADEDVDSSLFDEGDDSSPADDVDDDDVEDSELLEVLDSGPPEEESSACATAVPVANAALKPSVSALAPNHLYG